MEAQSLPPPYTLWQLVTYFLGLGTYGFGGLVALVGYMHRNLVERASHGHGASRCWARRSRNGDRYGQLRQERQLAR